MKSAWKLCAILFVATLPLAAQTSTPSKPKKAKSAPVTAADVQALKDAIAAQQSALAAQQQQIQALQDQLRSKDQAVQQAQTAASDASSKADAAQSQATQQQQSVTELKSDVADLKTNVNNTALSLQDTQKNVNSAMESPLALHFKGITITPGGFLAAESVRRSRALASDVNTPFNSVTVPGASQSSLSEFFASGRQSRVSMLAEGSVKGAKLAGYVEADFLSAGVTSNSNGSNSYTLRQRQAWGQVTLDNGFSVTGGQMWSLATETKHGVDNRTEALPMTIDANYSVGFTWARQYGLRIAQNFNNKFWLAASIENSQATLTSHGNASNFLVGSIGTLGGLYNNQANYSFNPAPDVIVKAVWEPGFGHYEVFGIYSRFRDRVFPCAEVAKGGTCAGLATASVTGSFNSSTDGGGVGANARWSFYNKHVDFGLHGFLDRGLGRYASGGLPDTAVHANGTLDLIRNYQGLATLEWHGPKLDIYANVGAEYARRTDDFDPISLKQVGYGAPSFDNTGCFTEVLPGSGGFAPGTPATGTCTADTRSLVEGTIGFWHRIYSGPKGRLQWGPQFSYVNRDTWFGKSAPNQPHGLDGMIFTSLRYYLP